MNRRTFLYQTASSGLLCGLAGCTGLGDEEAAPSDNQEATGRVEQTTPEPAVKVSVTNSELTSRETQYRIESAVTGTIKNTGDVVLGYVTATAAFYNSSGDLLTTTLGEVRLLNPGEVWEPWLPYPDNASKVDSAELRISKAGRLVRTPSPGSVDLLEKSLSVPQDSGSVVQVNGRVKNSSASSIDYLDARSKVYANNNHVLGTGITSVSNVSSGDVWRFDAPVYLRNPDWNSRLNSYDVVVTQ